MISLTDNTFAARGLPRLDAFSPLNQSFRRVDWASGTVVPKQKRTNVAIVGGHPSGNEAPLYDRSWEIWGVNGCIRNCINNEGQLRADRWFELHDLNERVCRRRRPKGYARWLRKFPIPLYQFHRRRDARLSVQYPLDRVIATGRDYFGCTFAYQVGLAIAEGFTTIGLYGAALMTAREALVERPTVEWWMGLAQGRGITVLVPESYSIGLGRHPYRYAFDQVAERDATFQFCRGHLDSNVAYICSRSDGLA